MDFFLFVPFFVKTFYGPILSIPSIIPSYSKNRRRIQNNAIPQPKS